MIKHITIAYYTIKMSNEEPNNEYLQRFEAMGTRMEELVVAIGNLKASKARGIAARTECLEKCIDVVFEQLKDIHETLIDLNNNFVDSSSANE